MAFFKRGETDHAIRELQSAKNVVVAGAAINTNIAIAGITTKDTLGSVMQFVAGVPTGERVGEASITSAGNIRLTTTNTTGHVLVVEWYKKVGYK